MNAAQASDFLRVFALDNHASLSTNDLRQIEEVRTFLRDLLGAFAEFEWGRDDLQYMLEKVEGIVR